MPSCDFLCIYLHQRIAWGNARRTPADFRYSFSANIICIIKL